MRNACAVLCAQSLSMSLPVLDSKVSMMACTLPKANTRSIALVSRTASGPWGWVAACA